MVIRRLLAFVALLAGLAACTLGNNPPQTAAGVPLAGEPPLPADIEREVGPAYTAPTVQAFVDRVGRRVVANAGLSGTYHFYVLDDPVANAHAVSSGYVFVTRGLLALIEDEAELAAAFGHELGHVVMKHATRREQARREVIDAAVEATLTSGSVTVGRSVAREGLLALRRYSREQELEADRLGLGYITRAGYRGDAMMTLIDRLQRQMKLEDDLMGPIAEPGEHGALSTHPDPDQRLAALRTLESSRAPGFAGRPDYLAAVDGMSVDDAPEEGFVRGASFLHPTLRLAFDAPRDFRLYNDHDGVLGVGRDRSLLYFSCLDDKVSGHLDDWMRNQLKPTPTDIQAAEIGGEEAAIGAKPRGSDTGLGQIRYVLVRHGDGLCYFNLLSDGPDRDRRIETLVAAARTLRTLTLQEAEALRPYRLRVIAPDGASAAALAARMPYPDHKMERLLTLNGVDQPAELLAKERIKVVEP